jgi:hypothetical protein
MHFISELRMLNPYDSADGCKSRRTDLVQIFPKCVRVYELKAHAITLEDISQTLFDKKYLEVIANAFPGKPIDFRFTSPLGITPEAEWQLSMMGSDKYMNKQISGLEIRYKLSYQSTQDLAQTIYTDILKITPSKLRWQIDKHLNSEYEDILPKKLLTAAV